MIGPSGFNFLPASTVSPGVTFFIFATHGESGGVQVGLKIIVCAFANLVAKEIRIANANLVRLDQRSILKEIHAKRRNVDDHARVGRDSVWSFQHFRRTSRRRPPMDHLWTSIRSRTTPVLLLSVAEYRLVALWRVHEHRRELPSSSSALLSRSRAISSLDTRLSESICSFVKFQTRLQLAHKLFVGQQRIE